MQTRARYEIIERNSDILIKNTMAQFKALS